MRIRKLILCLRSGDRLGRLATAEAAAGNWCLIPAVQQAYTYGAVRYGAKENKAQPHRRAPTRRNENLNLNEQGRRIEDY